MFNFLIVVNDKYIKYAKSLIYSIAKHHSDYQVFLYLINPSKKNVKKLSSTRYNICVKVIEKELSQEVINIYSEEAAYCANIRGKLLKELVETQELDNLTYIDADSLMRGSIEGLFLQSYDVSFFVRPPTNAKKTMYFSGLISLKITTENKPVILQALDYFQNKIDNYGLTTWFSDQNAIEDLYYFIVKNNINFYALSKEYFDWGYQDTSKIWMGKGKSKSNNEYMTNQALCEGLFNGAG